MTTPDVRALRAAQAQLVTDGHEDLARGLDVFGPSLEARLPGDDEQDAIDREAQARQYAWTHGDSQTREDFLAGWDAAVLAAGFTRRPTPSREEIAQVISDFLAPILGQSPGGPSRTDYGLADAVIAAITDTEKK